MIRAGIVQFDVALGHVNRNLKQAVRGIRALAGQGCALILLPEMFTSGFDNENLSAHGARSPEVLEKLAKEASSAGVVLVGTLPELGDNGIHNTARVVGPEGIFPGKYRKIHLFKPTDEHKFFLPGHQPAIIDTQAGRLGFLICYDVRFPELSRVLALGGAQILCVMAQWPEARHKHWETLLKARAIENQCFVIGANRCGKDPETDFAGRSMIIG